MKAAAMLVTDVGDKMCWRQLRDVGGEFKILMIELMHLKITNTMNKMTSE